MSELSQQLDAWRAQVIGVRRRFTVGRIDMLWSQRYAAAVDDLNPLYFDEVFARTQGLRGLIAPPNYLTTMRDEASWGPSEAEMQADGLPAKSGPPVPGLAAMGGGQEILFHAPVYCGEHITGEKQIVNVTEQAGRNGVLVVVEEEIRYINADGEAKLTLRNTVLYRVLKQESNDAAR